MTTREQINAKEAEKLRLEVMLSETDWQAIRFAETGTPISENVSQARTDARLRISTLREEIADLYEQLAREEQEEPHEPAE